MLNDISAKYESLKGHYAQLLSSFDQSEELRKVYKQLIVDQKLEINRLGAQGAEGIKSASYAVTDYHNDHSLAIAPITAEINRYRNLVSLDNQRNMIPTNDL